MGIRVDSADFTSFSIAWWEKKGKKERYSLPLFLLFPPDCSHSSQPGKSDLRYRAKQPWSCVRAARLTSRSVRLLSASMYFCFLHEFLEMLILVAQLLWCYFFLFSLFVAAVCGASSAIRLRQAFSTLWVVLVQFIASDCAFRGVGTLPDTICRILVASTLGARVLPPAWGSSESDQFAAIVRSARTGTGEGELFLSQWSPPPIFLYCMCVGWLGVICHRPQIACLWTQGHTLSLRTGNGVQHSLHSYLCLFSCTVQSLLWSFHVRLKCATHWCRDGHVPETAVSCSLFPCDCHPFRHLLFCFCLWSEEDILYSDCG